MNRREVLFLKLKTMRVRRSHPSALSAALALMLTMLFVYLISLSAASDSDADSAASATASSANIRMEALSVAFEWEGRYELPLEARIAAARCTQSGGAGLILRDGAQYAVIRCVASAAEGENILRRAAAGLTLQISGSAEEIQSIADAVDFLRGQASETGSLAQTLETGSTDANAIETLLDLYRTRGKRTLEALKQTQGGSVVSQLICAVSAALDRLNSASPPDPGKLRLIHAAACADWIDLLESFASSGSD